MNKVEQIKAEIEQRITDNTFGAKMELIDLLAFIDSLPEEKPSEDLDKEIEKYYYDRFAFISSAHNPTIDILTDIALHFYELGKQAQKEQMMKQD